MAEAIERGPWSATSRRALACPGCGAPKETKARGRQRLRCDECGAFFLAERAEEAATPDDTGSTPDAHEVTPPSPGPGDAPVALDGPPEGPPPAPDPNPAPAGDQSTGLVVDPPAGRVTVRRPAPGAASPPRRPTKRSPAKKAAAPAGSGSVASRGAPSSPDESTEADTARERARLAGARGGRSIYARARRD